MKNRESLRGYQNKIIAFAKEKKKCGLFLDMGVGKTVITMTILDELKKEGKPIKALVLAPLSVVKSVWCEDGEVQEWEHLKNLKVVSCWGNATQRKEALDSDADVYAINNENVKWLVQNYSKKWKWNCLIVDESSCFKHANTMRFKSLRRTLDFYEYVILLTGTPAGNSLLGLWSQLFLIDRGKRLESTKGRFLMKYFYNAMKGGVARYASYVPIPTAMSNITEKIKDVCVWYSLEGEYKLNEPIYLNKYVELPNDVKKRYNEMERDLIFRLTEERTVFSFASQSALQKLAQINNGFIYDEPHPPAVVHKEKIKCLQSIMDEYPSENLFVAYKYKHDKEMIKEEIKEAVFLDDNLEQNIKDWNAGKIRVLCCHPQNAGHGINAQYGGSIVVWYGLTTSFEHYSQLNARIHRTGQKKTVRVVHIVTKNGLDARFLRVLQGRNVNQSKLLDDLKMDFINNQ